MAGITDGVPEVAKGEPIRLGDNGEYELEHEPITDRLIVRDTANDKEAYVRPETNEQIGNQGAFIRSLVNGKPLADNGRTYSTVQEAERAASGWVFVPPGTFNETVSINTTGLTLVGSGYGSLIDSGSDGIVFDADDTTVKNLRIEPSGIGVTASSGANLSVERVVVENAGNAGIQVRDESSPGLTITNCVVRNAGARSIESGRRRAFVCGCITDNDATGGIRITDGDSPYIKDTVVCNNIVKDAGFVGIEVEGKSSIVIGNRIINSSDDGIFVQGSQNAEDNIVANNRISDSGTSDVDDGGTNTVLDANLTGSAN